MVRPAPTDQSSVPGHVRLYDATCMGFDLDARRRVRLETYGEDIGQNGWLTAEERRTSTRWLGVGEGSRVLDFACASGGPSLDLARGTGATVVGVDIDLHAIQTAGALAAREGLAALARFEAADTERPLHFADGSFDAVVCVDAINHLPDRRVALADRHRLLGPGGSISTDDVVEVARRRREARDRNALVAVEGEETFEGLQRFLSVVHTLAAERRLARYTVPVRKVDGIQKGRNPT